MRTNDNIRIKKDHIRMIKNLTSMNKEGKITNLNTNKRKLMRDNYVDLSFQILCEFINKWYNYRLFTK